MKTLLVSFLSGFIFSVGLIISGMANPSIVKGFLDISGEWNFSLAFVMGGAVAFNYFSFKYILKRGPLLSPSHLIPNRRDIDKNLILGSLIFGIGWGLLGICPGPGLVNLSLMTEEVFIFMASVLIGMFLYKKLKLSESK